MSLIETELNLDMREYWFYLKKQKFMHNIDTFYYTVELFNDFGKDSEDDHVKYLRRFFNGIYADSKDLLYPLTVPGCHDVLNIVNGSYAGQYVYHIECPEEYDIFIAENTRNEDTSQILVQIRSHMLWFLGVHKAFEKSYEAVKSLCSMFHLQIAEVKENRIDYCWHTNYIQNPETYFRPDRFAEMQVSHYDRVQFNYQIKQDSEIESDYIALGKRKGKCFIRIYLKTKEVCEKKYKPFFFKFWLLNNLISRYDYDILERTFQMEDRKCWTKVDINRLKWYLDYGSNNLMKNKCQELINAKNLNYKEISKLANFLTPKLTKIINIEYQVMRKATKSYQLVLLRDNEVHGVAKRIYDFFDNHKLITDYLTHSQLRLVLPSNDTNKSRAKYSDFWETLRNTKMVDVKNKKYDIKLIRDYSRNMNKQLVKTRMYNGIISYSLYEKGINNDDVEDDLLLPLMFMNDNDMHKLRNRKFKNNQKANREEFSGIEMQAGRKLQVIDAETGEVLYGS